MTLSPETWQALETHGVTAEHLALLLRVLQTQRNGSLAWHFAQGQVCTCDMRLTFPGKPVVIAQVSEVVYEEKWRDGGRDGYSE